MKIDAHNYETWMIEHMEGNLSPAEEKALQEFLAFHPELRHEMELFEMTRLTPDTGIVFEHKDALKKEVPAGRVLFMGNAFRYMAAAAAITAVFVGVRYFTIKEKPGVIRPYAYEMPGLDSFQRNTTVIGTQTEKPVVSEKTFAVITEDTAAKKEQKPVYIDRERNPIAGVDVITRDKIQNNGSAGIKNLQVVEEETQFAQTDEMRAAVIQNSTVISLNDNKTVVDWWIDAVAIGGEVGSVVEDVREADLNPFRKKTSDTDVRTRSIDIPGFNYYSRKSNN